MTYDEWKSTDDRDDQDQAERLELAREQEAEAKWEARRGQ